MAPYEIRKPRCTSYKENNNITRLNNAKRKENILRNGKTTGTSRTNKIRDRFVIPFTPTFCGNLVSIKANFSSQNGLKFP